MPSLETELTYVRREVFGVSGAEAVFECGFVFAFVGEEVGLEEDGDLADGVGVRVREDGFAEAFVPEVGASAEPSECVAEEFGVASVEGESDLAVEEVLVDGLVALLEGPEGCEADGVDKVIIGLGAVCREVHCEVCGEHFERLCGCACGEALFRLRQPFEGPGVFYGQLPDCQRLHTDA